MPEMKEGGVNVTPLIDVVMCLIIFFMLVAKIGVNTGAIKLDLPSTIYGKKVEELKGTIIINVQDPNIIYDANKQIVMENGKAKRRVGGTMLTEPTITGIVDTMAKDPTAKEIKLTLRDAGSATVRDYPLRRALEAAVRRNKEFSVTIRAEKYLEFRMLQQVLVEIANAGVKNVNYGAVGKTVSVDAPAK